MHRKTTVFALLGLCLVPYLIAEKAGPLVSTYSIVARDTESGEIGVAVQSHWFSVGSIVCWAEAGVGAVATQSFVDPSYGPLGLRLMRSGKSPQQALSGLLKADSHPEVRQVAMIDSSGAVAVHTGESCIVEAGHFTGDGYSCQANMMEKDTVPAAMAAAFERTEGALVDRLLAALEAAQAEKGDIRGKQSAAIIVVAKESSGVPWKGRLFDLRVEDHSQPLKELGRLIRIAKAYRHMNQGDEYLAEKKLDLALESYSRAMKIYPDNPELMFWPATLLAASGRVEESLPLFRKVFARNPNWGELLKRLPAAGQFPDDPALLKRILKLLQD